jgi:hypothetical protein
MAVNYGLLEPVNIAGNMMAGQQEAQRNQLAQQQLKQSGMQMEQTQLQVDQLKRDRDALATLQQQFVANGKSPNLEENFGAMIQSGIPHFVDIGTQGLQKIQQQKQFANIMGGGGVAPAATPAAAPVAPVPAGALGSGTYDVNAPVTPVNALAPVAAPAPVSNALSPDVSGLRQKRDALLAMGTQQSIAAAKALDADIAIASREPVYHNVPGVGLVDPRTKQIIMSSVESTQPEIKQYEYAKGQGYKGSLFDFKREMAIAGRAPAAPRPEQPPVAVVDPATGKQIYVTREQSFGMTPATSTEGLSTKEIQKREAVLPQARQAVKTVGNTMSVIDETVDRLLANPDGLNGITGTIYGRTPAFTDAANTANADLEQLRNLAFVQGLTELRAASKTGAGVGNVSNREGERFENLKASLDRRQSKTDLENALRRLKEQAAFTRQTMQEAFDETYQYKQAAPAAAAPAASGLNVVVTPDGQSHTFQTPAAAAQFKKAAGIK